MRIGVDLDNCLYPFVSVFRQYVHQSTGRPMAELPDETCWDFYSVQWGFTTEEFLSMYEAAVDDGPLFFSGTPISGSLEALHHLRSLGHTLHIVTDRRIGRRWAEGTVSWLDKWKVPYDSLTFSADKTIVDVDVLIDDRPRNVQAARAVGIAAFLFDYGREDQVGDLHPVRSWAEFTEVVAEMQRNRDPFDPWVGAAA